MTKVEGFCLALIVVALLGLFFVLILLSEIDWTRAAFELGQLFKAFKEGSE